MNEQKMNDKKDMHQTDTLQCSICHKTFHTQEELQKHNRESHPQGQGQMKDQGHRGHAGSGSEEQHSRPEQNQGAERNPNFDKGQERKAPGSEQKQPEHKRPNEERHEPNQKRAAS